MSAEKYQSDLPAEKEVSATLEANLKFIDLNHWLSETDCQRLKELSKNHHAFFYVLSGINPQNVGQFLDDQMRTVFFIGGANYILQLLQGFFYSLRRFLGTSFYFDINNGFGAGWNFFDVLAGFAAAYAAYKNLGKVGYRRTFSEFWIATDVGMSAQLTAATTMTLLAQYGVLHGSVASLVSPVGGFGFALCMWAAFARAVQKLDRSIKKSDPAYLLEDKIKKYESLQKKIKSSAYDFSQEEIFKKMQERLLLEMQAIIRMNKDDPNFKNKYEFFNKYALSEHIKQNPTEDDEQIFNYLKNRQDQKIKRNTVAVVGWGLAAIGMTLVAFAPFFPLLAAPGMVIAAVAGTVKLCELVTPWVLTYKARKAYEASLITTTLNGMERVDGHHYFSILLAKIPSYQDTLKISEKAAEECITQWCENYLSDNGKILEDNKKDLRKKLDTLWRVLKEELNLPEKKKMSFLGIFFNSRLFSLQDQNKFLNNPLNYLTRKEKAQARMAYELSYLNIKNPSEIKKIKEEDYYKSLLELDKITRDRLLDSALEKYTENKIVEEKLKGNSETMKNYREKLSQKSKNQMVLSYFLYDFKAENTKDHWAYGGKFSGK